jgi:hypothetical protein
MESQDFVRQADNLKFESWAKDMKGEGDKIRTAYTERSQQEDIISKICKTIK